MTGSLQRAALHRGYRSGELTPADVVEEVYRRIEARGDDGVWISLVSRDEALVAAEAVAERYRGRDLPPLYGLPFAVKDNVDVAGMVTTAACPGFAYQARSTAPVVERALAAGAVLVGKTNLDQFATGLTGTRSPYGIVRNPFDPRVIAGGSSSGSGVAVAAGLVTFAIGTDTAGSGRVPAGLTGTVGVKPTRGLLSTRGIVPACRSLDCPSVFALTVEDGAAVLAVLAGADPADPYSRALPVPPAVPLPTEPGAVRVGVPASGSLGLGEDERRAFEEARERLTGIGAQVVGVDVEPFVRTGALLYQGPWIAERVAGLEPFLEANPEALHPVTREVLAGAASVSGVEVFRGLHELAQARAETAPVWSGVDLVMVPTAPSTPLVDDVLADPIGQNSALGKFTNFVNLLDLAALAVPSAVTPAGVPVGVTFLAPAGGDAALAGFGRVWQRAAGLPLGATGYRLDDAGYALDDSGQARVP